MRVMPKRIADAHLGHLAAALGDAHGAEFPDVKSLAVEAAALLPVKHLAGAVELDEQRDDREQRRESSTSPMPAPMRSKSRFASTAPSLNGFRSTRTALLANRAAPRRGT